MILINGHFYDVELFVDVEAERVTVFGDGDGYFDRVPGDDRHIGSVVKTQLPRAAIRYVDIVIVVERDGSWVGNECGRNACLPLTVTDTTLVVGCRIGPG